MKEREFTGWHMLALMVVGFGIIITVNLTMAYKAISTFPGLETSNSYIASQQFNSDRDAQEALGWDVEAELTETQITITIDGAVHAPTVVSATLGRATHVQDDVELDLTWTGGGFEAPVELPAGYWNLRLVLETSDGTQFRRRFQLRTIAQE